jgi:hypothetical protein
MSERPSKHDGHCLVLMQAVQAPTELSFVGCTCSLAWRQRIWDLERRVAELEARCEALDAIATELGELQG